MRTSGERAVATLALTSCALLSPAVAGASLNDVDQAAPSVHRIKLFVDPAAVGDMGTAEGGRRLAQYTADVNTVFRRETVRRFVFDPATDLQRSSRRGCMCACWSAPRARCAPPSTDKACYERCRHLLRELEDAESSLAELSVNPRGRLRIDIHGAPANELGLPRIGEFHARYPHIELAVGSGDRLVDLVREGVDCVVRAGKPKDSSLVTRRLALIPQVTVASPAYLAANGTPLQPADLARHWAVNFFSASRTDFFPFDFEVDGRAETHMLRSWISVNSADSYKTCAEQGCGIIQVPRFHVERQLRAGPLVEILAHTPCPPMVYSVLYPHHRQLSPRVRVFIDWVTQLYDECFGPH